LQKLTRFGILAYEESGSGDAVPMLFIHGWGCNQTHFAPRQAFFGTSRRTVTVDLRGHGASDAPSQAYTMEGFADDLAWQCDQLGLTKSIVVGRSMGGNVALELAARYPDLVAAVVMIDSVLFPSPAFREMLLPLAEALCGPDAACSRDSSRLT
jgi:pimeloyl-ACP methyl ester carboxylesterase